MIPIYNPLTKRLLFPGIYLLLFFPSLILRSQTSPFSDLLSEFKKGNYSHVASESRKAIQASDYLPEDDRFILLYISCSSQYKAMDDILERSFQKNPQRGSVFYNSVYLFMERALVVGDHSLVEKWGFRFRKNGKSSSRYGEGLYIYASMFYETNRFKDSNYVIHLALQESPSRVLRAKLRRLKDYNNLEMKKQASLEQGIYEQRTKNNNG